MSYLEMDKAESMLQDEVECTGRLRVEIRVAAWADDGRWRLPRPLKAMTIKVEVRSVAALWRLVAALALWIKRWSSFLGLRPWSKKGRWK